MVRTGRPPVRLTRAIGLRQPNPQLNRTRGTSVSKPTEKRSRSRHTRKPRLPRNAASPEAPLKSAGDHTLPVQKAGAGGSSGSTTTSGLLPRQDPPPAAGSRRPLYPFNVGRAELACFALVAVERFPVWAMAVRGRAVKRPSPELGRSREATSSSICLATVPRVLPRGPHLKPTKIENANANT